MQRGFIFLLSWCLAFSPAFGVDINGELRNAQLEKRAADPVTNIKEARVYWDTVAKQAKIYNGSAWSAFGSGSGSGALNLITNPNAESALTGIADVGTGTDVTRSSTASEIALSPAKSTAIKVKPESSGTGYTRLACIAIPDALKNTKLGVEFYQDFGAGYTAGDLTLSVYSQTDADCNDAGTRLALSSDASSVSSLPAMTGKYSTSFDTSSASYYALRITRAAGTAGATNWLTFGEVYLGPGITPQGLAGDTISITPTYANATGIIVTNNLNYSRVGDRLIISGLLMTTGNGTDAAAFSMAFPGLTVIGEEAGFVYAQTSVTSLGIAYSAIGIGGSLALYNANSAAAAAVNGTQMGTTSGRLRYLWFNNVSVKIQEWAGSTNLAQNSCEYAFNSSTSTSATDIVSFGYGIQGAPIQAITTQLRRRVRFQTPILAGQPIRILLTTDRKKYVEAGSQLDSYNVDRLRFDGTNQLGVGPDTSDSASSPAATDIDFRFGTYRSSGSAAWSNVATYYWVAEKCPIGSAGLGFAQATQTNLGLVKAGQIPGTNTNDSAEAGKVGEEQTISLLLASANGLATTVAENMNAQTFVLTPGEWEISGSIGFNLSSTTSITQWIVSLSPTSGTLGSSANQAVPNAATCEFRLDRDQAASVPSGVVHTTIPTYSCKVPAGSTSTLYPVMRSNFTVSTNSVFGYIRARRVR